MTPQDFDNLLQDTFMVLEDMLSFKASVYAPNTERFHNFLVAARMKDESPEKAGYGFWTKQYVALMDLINRTNEEKPFKHGLIKNPPPSKERIDELIHDIINYLILTKGMLYERYGYEPESKQLHLDPDGFGPKTNDIKIPIHHRIFPPTHFLTSYPSISFPKGVWCETCTASYVSKEDHDKKKGVSIHNG